MPVPGDPGHEADTEAMPSGPLTGPGSTSTPGPGPMPTSPPPPSSTSGNTTLADGSSSDDGHIFLLDPDVPAAIQCDVWEQDCPPGEKCQAVSLDEDSPYFNATRCRPIADDTVGIGESCIVEDYAFSGYDNCGADAFCFFTNTDLIGTCIERCAGSAASPTCSACHVCPISSRPIILPCLPECDPLLDDCPAGQACHFFYGSALCIADGAAQAGDPCEHLGECAAGLECRAVCDGELCCTPRCRDDADCTVLPNTTCVDEELSAACGDLTGWGTCV